MNTENPVFNPDETIQQVSSDEAEEELCHCGGQFYVYDHRTEDARWVSELEAQRWVVAHLVPGEQLKASFHALILGLRPQRRDPDGRGRGAGPR